MVSDEGRHTSVMSADFQLLAGVYAEALLDHLGDTARAEQAADELDALAGILDEVGGAEELFSLPLSLKDRCEQVDRIFAGRVSEPLAALLSVMARRGRMALLRALAGEFRRMLDARQGRIEVTVTTAQALSDTQRRQLCRDIERTFGARPVLAERVEANIIGGAVIQVGEVAYDASLAADLVRFGRDLTDRMAAHPPRPAGQTPP